jgi:uncharacterized protein (UPF0261 family)
MAQVLIIGTMDTKGPESAYLADRLRAFGCTPRIMDVGILGEAEGIACEWSREAVARAAGTDIEALRKAGTRGRAVEQMREGARAIARDLASGGTIHGAVALGGAEGSVLAAAAMQELPLGVFKLIVSPIASGQRIFAPFVGIADISVMHSIVDILGLNAIARQVFDSAAAAVAGAALARAAAPVPERSTKRQIAATMLGNTTMPLMWMRERIEAGPNDFVVFHANGVGGRAMEQQISEGRIDAVIDFTLSEITGEIAGGFHNAGPGRLRAAGQAGLPQVIVPSCVDFMVCGPLAEVPAKWQGRPTYFHNPEFTLVRASRDEQLQAARTIAERLNAATGPVAVLVPTGGLSVPNCARDPDGRPGPFWAPDIDAEFRRVLKAALNPAIAYRESDHHINDNAFARIVLDAAQDLFDL